MTGTKKLWRKLFPPGTPGGVGPLWLGFGVLTSLLLVLGIYSTRSLCTISRNVYEQADKNVPRMVAGSELDTNVMSYVVQVRAFVGGFEESRSLAEARGEYVADGLSEYQRLAVTARQREMAALLVAQWQELHNHGEALLSAGRAEPEQEKRLVEEGIALDHLMEDEIKPDAHASYDERKILTINNLAQISGITLLILGSGIAIALGTSTTAVRRVLLSQAAVRESEERFRLFMNSSPAIAWVKDEQGRYVYITRPFEERFGIKAEDLRGKTDAVLWAPETAETFRKNDLAVLAGERAIEVVEETVNPDGSRCSWLTSKVPFRDTAGERFVAGIGIDITARREAEAKLKASLRDLHLAQQELVRQERLATLGKLAVIRSNAFFLEQCYPTANQHVREVLAETNRAIANSDHIISEMLDYVREPGPCDSVFAVKDAISPALRSVPLPENIHLRAPSLAGGAEIMVRGSQEQVTRILVNLIQNAVQAMPGGGELEIAIDANEQGRIQVVVRDTGCGIPAENLGKIFEPLFSTKTVGIGLGLAIAKRYAEMNHGELTVESEPGHGTTFRLRLVAGMDQ